MPNPTPEREETSHKLRCLLGLHNWNKWRSLRAPVGDHHVYIYQIRECRDCNMERGRAKCEVRTV